MGRNSRGTRRTPRQSAADRRSTEVAARLGRMLADARRRARLTQAEAATSAGIAQPTWSRLETNPDNRITLATWNRAAMAVGSNLDAYLKRTSAATEPRDAVHLRHQELIVRTALAGGWRALPEQQIDREARTSRAADVFLQRGDEYALIEIWDWFDDVGAALREWDRRLGAVERLGIARMATDTLPRTAGCWTIRATRRNRRLLSDHRNLFRARFPGSARAWLAVLATHAPTPERAALLWISVSGDRIYPARLRLETA